jgi:hypothetical protein
MWILTLVILVHLSGASLTPYFLSRFPDAPMGVETTEDVMTVFGLSLFGLWPFILWAFALTTIVHKRQSR